MPVLLEQTTSRPPPPRSMAVGDSCDTTYFESTACGYRRDGLVCRADGVEAIRQSHPSFRTPLATHKFSSPRSCAMISSDTYYQSVRIFHRLQTVFQISTPLTCRTRCFGTRNLVEYFLISFLTPLGNKVLPTPSRHFSSGLSDWHSLVMI